MAQTHGQWGHSRRLSDILDNCDGWYGPSHYVTQNNYRICACALTLHYTARVLYSTSGIWWS